MSGVSEIRLRVRYAETDQMGVVYHANYFVWMEMGRVELCRSMGVRYRDLEEKRRSSAHGRGGELPLSPPARYDDEVMVETSVKRSTSRLLKLDMQFHRRNRAGGSPLAQLYTFSATGSCGHAGS